jgi:hypothetical protein
MWKNMRAHHTTPTIHAELLMVFRMDYTMRILPCPLVLVVNIDDADSAEKCLLCKYT